MKKIFISLVVFVGLISVSHIVTAADPCVRTATPYNHEQGLGWYGYFESPVNADGTTPPHYFSGTDLIVTWNVVGHARINWTVVTPDGQISVPFTVNVVNCLSMSTPTFLCSGNSHSFTISDTMGSTSYSWTAPSGWTINGGSNTLTTSSTSVTIVVSNPSTHGYNSITVSGNNSGSRTFNVWVGAPGAATVYASSQPNANPVNLQQSTSYTFYSQAVGATSHMWFLPASFSFSLPGITSGSPVYITTANYGGTFSIHTKVSNTCGSSISSTLQVILPGTGEEGSRKASDDAEPVIDQPNVIEVDVPYPIPSRDHININLSQSSTIKLISLQGITVREITSEGQTMISTDDLSAGVYLLKLQNDKGLKQFKVSIYK